MLAKFVHLVPEQRSSRKPVSLLEVSVHRRSTRVADTAVAVSPVGALGAVGAGWVVA